MDDSPFDEFGNHLQPENESDRDDVISFIGFPLELMSNPDHIRNVALVGSTQHGKTTFIDMLIEETIFEHPHRHQRYTDTRTDEQVMGMSIKAVPMSLVLEDSNSESYLCNIMDTPGHADFTDEVTAALRLADGAILVVDAAEGVLVNTKRAIRQAVQENLRIVVVINKVDRLMEELLPLEEVYDILERIIEEINDYITHVSRAYSIDIDVQINPALGNVCFASSSAGWSFTLHSFAKLYPEIHKITSNKDEFASLLWGDLYVHPTSQKILPRRGGKRSFVHFVLEPLYEIYKQVTWKHKESVVATSSDDFNLNVRPLLRQACSAKFGTSTGFTDMLVRHVPSSKEAALVKAEHVYAGVKDSTIYQAIVNCDPACPLMVNVTKLYPKSNSSDYYAFGRVYSGEILIGQEVRVVGEEDAPDDEYMHKREVSNLWVYQARYKIPILRAPPGSWVLIEGVDESILRTATLCGLDDNDGEMCKFRPLSFTMPPVVQIVAEILDTFRIPRMERVIRNICKSYPLASVETEKSGCTILGTGKLYLDSIMKDLRKLYPNVHVKADPVVSFRETAECSSTKCSAETRGGKNKITMMAEPLKEKIATDIEKGVVSIDGPETDLRFFFSKQHNWDLGESSIWAFGPDEQGPNILIDDTLSNEVDKGLLNTVKISIVKGFKSGAQRGCLCDEPIRGVQFKIVDAKIDSGNRGLSLVSQIAQRAVLSSFGEAKPRLMEPIYLVEIQSSNSCMHDVQTMLYRHVDKKKIEYRYANRGYPFFIVTAPLPVRQFFGFEKELKSLTEEKAVGTYVFDHWALVPGDPLNNKLEPARAQNMARELMLKRKCDKDENLKNKLFEKLKHVRVDLASKSIINDSVDVTESSKKASIREFAEAVRAYKVNFLHSEPQLSKIARSLVTKHFEAIHQHIKEQVHPEDLLATLRVIWTYVLMMDEVLPKALLPDFALQSARVAVKEYISNSFSRLIQNISDSLTKIQVPQKEGIEEEYSLQTCLEASKNALTQGSRNVLQEFRELLDGNTEFLLKFRDLTVDWVQEGFQNFFRKLNAHFLSLSGKSHEDVNLIEGIQGDKITTGLVLVLAQLSLLIEQSVIPTITEEIASFFSGGSRGFERGSAFIPADICPIFQSSAETFLHLYINNRTQKISVLLKQRFTAPNWMNHKEPREVHMFVDLLLHEFKEMRSEVKQILPQGLQHTHRCNDRNDNTTSSSSNPLRDDGLRCLHTQKTSKLLENRLAKLSKQKMGIFTEIKHSQDSVITTIVKLSLKSYQEFVHLQTFNRSGFQQIQLDNHFLKKTLKDIVEDGAIDLLLDEVIAATVEHCRDPIPLELPVLDRLVQEKLAKTSE